MTGPWASPDRPPWSRKPGCSMCGRRRRIVRVMRRAGEGDCRQDDPDYAIRICDACDLPLPEGAGGQ